MSVRLSLNLEQSQSERMCVSVSATDCWVKNVRDHVIVKRQWCECNSFKLIIAYTVFATSLHDCTSLVRLGFQTAAAKAEWAFFKTDHTTKWQGCTVWLDPGIWIVWMAKFFHVISWWKIVAVWSWQWSLPIRKHCWVASPHATERRQQARSHLQYHLQIQTDKKVII